MNHTASDVIIQFEENELKHLFVQIMSHLAYAGA
jgi:hypothetical protein